MSKLAHEVSKRIIAVALSIAMIMSNMTVYAAESGQVITEERSIETSSKDDGVEDVEVKKSTEVKESEETETNAVSEEIEEVKETDTDGSFVEETLIEETSNDSNSDVSDFDDEASEAQEETDETVEESEDAEEVSASDINNRSAKAANSSWDFSDGNFKDADLTAGYNGLIFSSTNVGQNTNGNTTYLTLNNGGYVQIPIDAAKDSTISVGYSYAANAKFEDEETASIYISGTGGSGTALYYYVPGSKLKNSNYVTVTGLNNGSNPTYITSIKVETFTRTDSWIFGDSDFQTNYAYASNSAGYNYNGLKISKGAGAHSGYFYANNSHTISVPVRGDCTITVSTSNAQSYYFKDEGEEKKQTGAGTGYSYKYTGGARYVDIVATGTTYFTKIAVEYPLLPAAYDSSLKKDVWSFHKDYIEAGANNMLATITTGDKKQDRYDIIKNWYDEELEGGTSGKLVKTGAYLDMSGGLKYYSNGVGNTNFSTGIHVYSADYATDIPYSKTGIYILDADGDDGDASNHVYYGMMYGFYQLYEWYEITADTGDFITVYATNKNTGKTDAGTIIEFGPLSNAGTGTLKRASEPQTLTVEGPGTNEVHKLKFYAEKAGTYYICSTNTRMNIARITREHLNPVAVSGTLTLPAGASDLTLVFTDKMTGEEHTAEIESGGTYNVTLYNKHSYTVSVTSSSGSYAIEDEELSLSLSSGDGLKYTFNSTVTEQELITKYTLKGKITGLDTSDIAKLTEDNFKLVFENTEEKYKPKVKITFPESDASDLTYEASLQDGIAYEIKAEGIDDYETDLEGMADSLSDGKIKITENKDLDIAYKKKTTYAVTINPSGKVDDETITETMLKEAGAKITFTNTAYEDESYKYPFNIGDEIKLRDGTYSVRVTDSAYINKSTLPNLTVNGGTVSYNIEYKYADSWDFSAADWNKYYKYSDNKSGYNYNGLQISSGSGAHGGKYLYANKGHTISVPVRGDCTIIVSTYNAQNYYFKDEGVDKAQTGSGDDYSYAYKGGTGYVDIVARGTTYFTQIRVKSANVAKIAKDFTLNFYDILDKDATKGSQMVESNIEGLTISGFTYFPTTNNHGIQRSGTGKMEFNLKQKASIIVTTCASSTSGKITAENGMVVDLLPVPSDRGETAPQYLIRANEGEVTLTFTINYLHKIELKYVEKEEYVTTVTNDGNGTASADKQIAAIGEKVTLTAEPKDVSYKFKEWEVVSGGSFTLSDEDKVKNPLEMAMPAEDVELKAVFEESGEEKPKIADDFTIDFYAGASKHSGEAVKSEIDGLVISDFKWTPSNNNHGISDNGIPPAMELNLKQKAYIIVTTCVFNKGEIKSDSEAAIVSLPEVSINNDKGAPQYFIRANAGEVKLNFTKGIYLHKIELVYVEDDNYVVTVSDSGNGSASADPKFAAEGDKVTLTATPDNRYEFSAWEVVSGDLLELTDAQKTTNPLTITMPAEEIEIKAIFEPTVRREWDFVNDETLIGDNGETVAEGQTATVAKLGIDATANGSGWDSKVTAGGSGAIAKNGTKITIPLESIYSSIEIAAETKDYKVNGKAANSAEDTFECESENKTTVIEMTADNHIQSIKVTPVYYAAEGLHDFTLKEADFKVDGFEFTGFTDQDNAHGFVFNNGAKIKLNLRKKANIRVLTCAWADGTGVTLQSSSGTVSGTQVEETGITYKGMKFIVLDAEGEVTLTFGGNKWLHNIIVEYIDEYEPGTRNIDVWDFGGKTENDTAKFKYNNNITANDLKQIVQTGGTFKAGPASFGGLTMYQSEKDKLHTNIEDLSDFNASKAPADAQHAYDGYTASGMWYVSNKGSSTSGCVEIKMQAGDKLIAYMGSSGNGDIEFLFEGQIGAAGDTDSVTIASGKYEKCEFVANKTGVYKIYATGNGRPAYHRFVRIPGVGVSGTLDFNGCNITTDYIVKFKNLTTRKDTIATVNSDNSFSAVLAPGYTYRAVLSGAKGFGFTTDSSVEVKDENYKNGILGKTLVIEEKSVYEYSGTIVGFASDYERISDLKVTMVADEDSESEDEPLKITQSGSDLTFTANLDPLTDYTFKLEGVNDYEVIEPDSVCNDDDGIYTGQTIKVALKPKHDVTGGFRNLPVSDTVKVNKLTFTNLEDEYVYEADINEDGKGYSVQLRDGEYIAAAEVTDYSTSTHVIVDGGAVSRDILFTFTGTKDKTKYEEKIYVGYTDGRENNYATVNEAVEACRIMDRSNPSEQRITVSIAPGEYREQIIVDVPYVSFVNESNKEVLLTWYYGIGYKYYSADSSGYYNPQNAYDKYEKHIADRWGVAVYVKSAATGFRADKITFENSFNRYITDEELADGVEVSGTESITVVRNYNTDVTSNAATERAAAIAIEADQAEFNKCGFYSSQDTLYTQGSHIYFKNCVMEGETDYIYGSGNCVFDACELSRKGYSDKESGGYITANRPASGDKGYLFRNCTITANHYNKLKVGKGYFGRPWGQDATVIFMNTKLQSEDLMKAEGWEKMGDATAVGANFWEYNTTTITGTAVDTSKRVRGVMTKEEANAVNIADYFGGWTPYYYVAEDGVPAIEGNMSVTNNADINAPHPGNTLTVHYSLGAADQYDASRISWYIVDSPDAATGELVKTSVASVDKTYQIGMAAEGKYIRVTVTPETFSGTVGEPKSFTVEQFIREGWNDPTGGGDITLGDGVNIFLAGDSTVMDYSAKGMYNGGKSLNEGSWGEFLQAFFNDKQVTIQNYAQGGRSSRTFINEGKLDNIKSKMSEGDYLFIQFGHNDCADEPQYIERYVPVGTPVDGVYPTTPGEKDSSGQYPNTSGTFKWYLKQYIDAAKEKGATPVLVTPVARMYYNKNGDGTIRPHHDDSTSSNDAYVTAMKQLAEEEDVLLIDGFKMTKTLFEEAWKACGDNTYGLQIMQENEDTTHNNKLGGLIEAALIAGAIQDMDLNISKVVKAPSQVLGAKTDGTTVFSINKNGELTAYDIHSGYANRAPYWEKIGQAMLDAIGEKANNNPNVSTVNEPKFSPEPANWDGEEKITLTATGADEIRYTTDGSNPTATTGMVYGDPITITETTTIKAIAVKDGEISNIVTRTYTVVDPTKETAATPTAEPDSGRIKRGTVVTLSTATQGAKIRYTMGTTPADPTEASTLYDSAAGIEITADTTIKAIAVNEGMNNSLVATFSYTVYDGNVDNEDGLVIDFVSGEKYTYTGSAITPAITVTYDKRILVEGDDYTVKYSNNVAASVGADEKKLPTVTVTGKGDLTGKAAKTFVIEQRSLTDKDIKAGSIAAVVNKKAAEPILYYNGIKLTKKNYQLAEGQSLIFANAGVQSLAIEGIGNFKDSKEITVKVYATQAELKAAAKKLNVTVDKDKVNKLVYTGSSLETAIKECITVEPKNSGDAFDAESDYIIALPNNLTNAGTVKFTVIGLGDYSGFTAGKSVKILPKTVSQDDITTDEEVAKAEGKILISGNVDSLSYVSTGASNGSLSLTWNGKKLTAGKDYKISYSGNRKVGSSAKYTITFMGNYKGKYTSAPFAIAKADLSKSTAVVTVPDMVVKKDGVYKAKTYVTIGGVTVNASEYTVKYYIDPDRSNELDKTNQVTFGEGETYKTVYVKIVPKDKNYTCSTKGNEAVGTYKVWLKNNDTNSEATDLSKAKITFLDKDNNKITKLEYQGGKAVEPYGIEVKVNGETVAADKYHCRYVNNVNKGKATVVINAVEGSGCIGGKTATFSIAARTITIGDWLQTAIQAMKSF